MGCLSSKENNSIVNVATINYSGIILSPFQFYAGQEENQTLKVLSKTFHEIAKKHKPEFDDREFKWNLGQLDKHWQSDRYSPIYNPTCGIKDNIYLEDQKEFLESWNDRYGKKKEYLQNLYIKNEKQKGSRPQKKVFAELEDHLQNCRTFDLIVYKSILKFVYNINSIDNVNVRAKRYRDFQRKMFSKPFLNEEEKAKRLIQGLLKFKLDVLFIQQTTTTLIKQIQKTTNDYRICKPGTVVDQQLCKSVILIRQKRFPGLRNLKQENNIFYRNHRRLNSKETKQMKLTEQQLKQLNFNNDTVIQVVGNLILICPHLSSKEKVNPQQMAIMKQCLYKLKIWFPQYHIICGGDLNGNCQFQGFSLDLKNKIHIHGKTIKLQENSQVRQYLSNIHFTIFPHFNGSITVNKKRTMIQPQRRKADKHMNGAKDFIISDLQLENTQIRTILGESTITYESEDIPLLPNEKHPFDHYLVTASVRLNKPLTHSYQTNILKLYSPQRLTKEQKYRIQNN